MQIDRKVQEMENLWKMLGPSDKAQYKAKLTAFKTRHQGIKNKFARQEERLGNEKDQNTLRIQQKKGRGCKRNTNIHVNHQLLFPEEACELFSQ